MNTVALPAYDRKALTPGIVHIGLGNFHRAHMAVYLDDLFAMGLDHDWAILGAGVRQGDAAMRAALIAQDCLSTVIELDPSDRRARRPDGSSSMTVDRQSCASSASRIVASPGRTPAPRMAQVWSSPMANRSSR